MRDIKWMEHVDGLIRVFKKYSAKSLWMLNMVKRLDTSNHHQPSINAHHLLLVFVRILTASSLCLCSCSPPCPPPPLHLSLSSSTLSSISLHLLLHVCPCPPCLVSLSLSSLSPSSLLVDEKLKAAPNHNLPSSSPPTSFLHFRTLKTKKSHPRAFLFISALCLLLQIYHRYMTQYFNRPWFFYVSTSPSPFSDVWWDCKCGSQQQSVSVLQKMNPSLLMQPVLNA